MSFDYGKETIEVKNPFKKEGKLFIIRGSITFTVGLVLLFLIRHFVDNGEQQKAWLFLVASLLLLADGLFYIVNGLLKVFRFLVGRNVPSSLGNDVSKTGCSERYTAYNDTELQQMLMGRKNLTFREPRGFIEHMLISMFNNFLFLPKPLRNSVYYMAEASIFTLLALVLYLLATISDFTGLLKIGESNALGWMGLILLVALTVVWFVRRPTKHNVHFSKISTNNEITNIILFVILSVLAPAIVEFAYRNGYPLPPVFISPFLFLFIFVLLAAGTLYVGYTLANIRAKNSNPSTSVSEFREHWQHNLHPRDLFRCFDMEMANIRFMEVPNRVYRMFSPKLQMEGSDDKGNFSGDTIQETQPILVDYSMPDNYESFKQYAALAGHGLVILGTIYLVTMLNSFDLAFPIRSCFNIFFLPIVFYIFSLYLTITAHLHWSELRFESYLVHFFAEGTYSESKISTGMSVYDSTRSENTVVRSSLSPWLLSSKITTCTFVDSGNQNLLGPRFVLEMNKSDNFQKTLVDGLYKFISGREIIANVSSEKDLQNTIGINTLNNNFRQSLLDISNNLLIGNDTNREN